jgi:hypothetical protein
MTRHALAFGRLAGCLAVAAAVGACSKGTLGDVGTGGMTGQVTGLGGVSGPSVGSGGAIGGVGFVGSGGLGGSGSGGVIGSGRGGFVGSGSGGFSGTGGPGQVPCPPPEPPVCGSLCGNGRIDSCTPERQPWYPGGCILSPTIEECDGADLGRHASHCAMLGYASGTPTCGAACLPESRGCSECRTGLPSLVSCGPLPLAPTESAAAFAMAATDNEVGLALVTYDDGGGGGGTLSFRRLTPALDVATNTKLLGTAGLSAGAYFDTVAVAPIPSGWVIATCVEMQLHVFTVDTVGGSALRAAAPVSADFNCAWGMGMASRPGGGPLLFWGSGASLNVAFVAADGRSVGAPTGIVSAAAGPYGWFDAAWVGDAFELVATIYSPVDYSNSLRVVRIDPTGPLTSRDLLIDGDFFELPKIVTGAQDLRMTFGATSQGPIAGALGVVWQRFGPGGEPLDSVELVRSSYGVTSSPAVAFGDDTVVLMGTTNSVALSVTRLGPDAAILTPTYEIARGPAYYTMGHAIVRRGPDVVIGWISADSVGPRMKVARLKP